MMPQIRLRLCAVPLLAMPLLFAALPPAAAQITSTGTGIANKADDSKNPAFIPQAKPSALPGSRVGARGGAAPAERQPSDMSPNEALFDAINRGDMASARDAVSRGADLSARNVLGLTPVDLAIDLGRNELTFMLLSMRGAGGSSAPPPPAGRTGVPSDLMGGATPAKPAPVRAAPVREAAVQPAPMRPRQSGPAADGTPVPSAGFLGFGGTR